MTMNNRAAAHRMLKARQEPPNVLPDSDENPGPGDSSPPGGEPNGPKPPVTPSSSPSSTKPPPTPTPPPTSSTRSPPPPPPSPTTTKETTSKGPVPTPPTTSTTSTSPSSSSSSSSSLSSSSSVSVSRSFSSTTTNTGATLIPAGNTAVRPQVTTFVSPTITPPDSLGTITVSPTPTDVTPSSGVKVGTVVGSVVGVIGGLAIIGIIIAFFLRRWRRRRGGDEDFDPAQFVRSPTMLESEFRDSPAGTPPYRASTFDPNPPSMAQRGHTNMASISSGAGMAGHGAYATPSAMHQRPQYTYGNNDYDTGHARDDDGSDIAHGAYSSEPKPQNVYNPEAYGSYAYSTEGNHAVQQQVYHPYQAQQQHYPEYRDAAPAPALVAGAPAVPAGRSSRQSVAINDEDVYGGI